MDKSGGALTVKHINEGCNALAELKEKVKVKGNLKEHLGNEQLAIHRSLL